MKKIWVLWWYTFHFVILLIVVLLNVIWFLRITVLICQNSWFGCLFLLSPRVLKIQGDNQIIRYIMTNDFRMSYFMPPIAPIKDEHGQLVTSYAHSLLRSSVEQVFQMITCTRISKFWPNKYATWRYTNGKSITITIRDFCGTFSRRSSKCLRSFLLTVVDIDYLTSYQEAVEMRKTLFNDPFHPALTFISPSGRGKKPSIL